MGWAAIFTALASGLTNLLSTGSTIYENKTQAQELADQAQEKADARAKKAKYAMQEQKTSFLKSGVYFNTGSPTEVIKETYDTAMEDIDAINDDSVTAQNKLIRQSKIALFSALANTGGGIAQAFASNSSGSTSSGSLSGTLTSGGISGDSVTYA